MSEEPLAQRVRVALLPLTSDFATEKRFRDSRGEGHLILNGPEVRRVGLFTLLPGTGHRGGHLHRAKNEYIYIVAGRGLAEFWSPESGERLSLELQAGHRLFMPAGVAHRFAALEPLTFVELSDRPYQAEDDLPVDFTRE